MKLSLVNKALLCGAALVAVAWGWSYLSPIRLKYETDKYVIVSFTAIHGGFYIGCMWYGAGYFSFIFPFALFAVLPMVTIYREFGRPNRSPGFRVGCKEAGNDRRDAASKG